MGGSLWERLAVGLRGALGQAPTGSPRARGQRAEAWAAGKLRGRGYRILERNLTTRSGEVDMVALHEGWLVIVEVRSYRQQGGIPPHAALSRDKQRRLRRLAEQIHRRPEFRRLPVRIDLVEVACDERGRPVGLEIYRGVC